MEIYIDKAFLDNFRAKYDAENDCHRNLRKFLSKANFGKVFLDFEYSNKEEFIDALDNNNFLDELINVKSVVADSSFKVNWKNIQFHNNGIPKLFFIDNENLTIDVDYGCFYTSSYTLDKCEWLFEIEDFRIDESMTDWSVLKKIKHPCNALILTDNYMFTNDTNYENLLSVLKNLMPKELKYNFGFHITLIGNNFDDKIILGQITKDILQELMFLFKYKISLSIVRKKHHARTIFTNYYRISGERGFFLFKNNQLIDAKFNTTIECKSITNFGKHSSTLETRNQELNYCKELYQEKKKYTYIPENRLFE